MPSREEMFDQVFTDHYEALVAWCRRIVAPHLGDPEDIVHIAYLRCRRSWRPNRRSVRNEAAYLYTSLRWAATDAGRNYRRRKTLEWAAARSEGIGDRSNPLRALVAQEAISTLAKRPQRVCNGILGGKTPAELRDELSLSDGALAVQLSRTKAKLRKFLELDGRSARHRQSGS